MKIAICCHVWMTGGVENYISNVVDLLDGEDFEFHLFSAWSNEKGIRAELPKAKSHEVVFKDEKPNLAQRTFKSTKHLLNYLNKENFDAVYVNTVNGSGFLYTWAAKKAGVRKRLIHCHSSDVGLGSRFAKVLFNNIFTLLFGSTPTTRIACCDKAGKFLFKNKPFTLVENCVDTSRFKFSETLRENARLELGINKHTALVGFVGRLDAVKNPSKQMEVFAEYLKINKDSKFLYVGGGDLLGQTKAKARELGVEKSVIFHDFVADTMPYYCALDLFLLPSFYEGSPIVLIEAQSCGLPVVASENATSGVSFLDLVTSLNLSEEKSEWAKVVHGRLFESNPSRELWATRVQNAGFGLDSLKNNLINVFQG